MPGTRELFNKLIGTRKIQYSYMYIFPSVLSMDSCIMHEYPWQKMISLID